MPLLEPKDSAAPAITSLVSNPDKEIKTTTKDVKSKIKALESQIGQMKKTDIEKSLCFSDLCIYSSLEYPQKFQVPKYEKYNGVVCP